MEGKTSRFWDRLRRSRAAQWLFSAETGDTAAEHNTRGQAELGAAMVVVGALVLVVAAMSGCGSSEASASEAKSDAPPLPVSYTLVNRSGQQLRQVVLYGNGLGKQLSYGSIAQDKTETLSSPEGLHVPPKVQLDWTSENGREYHQVDLATALGSNYRGPVRLIVDSAGRVTVSR